MGQAKNRGSFEERRQAALRQEEQDRAAAKELGLVRRPIREVIEELGLPSDSVFCGYAVHIPSSDEFLLSFLDQEHASTRQWTGSPALAKRFDEAAEAFQIARKDKGEVVVGVFETADQYLVAEVT
ncbi:hypothetical protein [Pseudomonas nicosulfuronedens]